MDFDDSISGFLGACRGRPDRCCRERSQDQPNRFNHWFHAAAPGPAILFSVQALSKNRSHSQTASAFWKNRCLFSRILRTVLGLRRLVGGLWHPFSSAFAVAMQPPTISLSTFGRSWGRRQSCKGLRQKTKHCKFETPRPDRSRVRAAYAVRRSFPDVLLTPRTFSSRRVFHFTGAADYGGRYLSRNLF